MRRTIWMPSSLVLEQVLEQETCLIDVLHQGLDRSSTSLLVLMDFSAALDTINHCILLDQLAKLGLGCTILQRFRSFLSNKVPHGDSG